MLGKFGESGALGTFDPSTVGTQVFLSTLNDASLSTLRLIRAELTLTPATAVAVPNNGSLVGVRGLVTLTSGKSVSSGYLYGTQGKFIGDGATLAVGSAHIAGVYAQMSLSGATVTSGHVAPLISCIQSPPASANLNMIYCESNSTNKINSILQAIVNADYAFDITSEDGNPAFIADAAGSSASKYLRIKVKGTEYKLELLAAS